MIMFKYFYSRHSIILYRTRMAPWKYEWGVMAFPDCCMFRLTNANQVPERDIVINHLFNEVKKGLMQ